MNFLRFLEFCRNFTALDIFRVIVSMFSYHKHTIPPENKPYGGSLPIPSVLTIRGRGGMAIQYFQNQIYMKDCQMLGQN